jgi:hypothetical protein
LKGESMIIEISTIRNHINKHNPFARGTQQKATVPLRLIQPYLFFQLRAFTTYDLGKQLVLEASLGGYEVN